MINKHLYQIAIAVIFLLSACTGNTVFSEYYHITNADWDKDSIIVFKTIIPDTSVNYDVLLLVRHTQQYRYQNMWLFVDDSEKKCTDTIEFYLADDHGRWLGNGYGNIREMPVLYEQNISFKADTLTFIVRQAMREDLLGGVSEIGLKIVEHGQK